ncbi:MAG: recombinase family protein [Candidatus Gastranaerophilales bacterium]|nr:recombinase family protein [Candidatus Gastranaerophilales bacterium]
MVQRIKAVIYARVSSEEQKKNGFSIDVQLDLLHEYASRKNIDVVKEFTEAETAKQTGRHKFAEMLMFLKKSKDVNAILVEKTDRLYRNFRDYVDVDDNKFEIHLVKENEIITPNSSSHAKLVHGLKVLLAKNFIDNLREETQKGRLKKASNGLFIGQVPYGYKKLDKNTTVIDEEKAPFVRRAFELYASGMSLEKVRWQLKNEGFIYQPSNKVISHGQLGKLLKNISYIGELNFRGVIYKGKHEPIISDELFEQAQISAQKDNKPLYRDEHSFAFAGLMTCAKCGCSITAEIKKGKYIYYHCTGGKGTCEQKKIYINEADLIPQFEEAVKAVSLAQKHIDYIKQGLKESLADKKEFSEQMRTNLESEANRIRHRIDKITNEYYDDLVDAKLYNEKRIAWNKDLDEIMIKLEALHHAEQKYYEEGVRIIETLKHAYILYKQQSPIEQRKLLNYLLSNCKLEGKKVSYDYNLPFLYFVNFDSCRKKYPGCDSNA